ncbi:MAG: tryptophan synthase subunit alpha [Bacteroidales bacterium]|jgi:tryptophan synthase alpha chain|nr:tryptophan synthase subunit alpha [Bacteroidales bacterium]
MNRINQLFEKKQQNILSIYITAGFPNIDDTATIISEIEKSGADMIEIGIPFSDPLADGKTIQDSSSQALQNGMSISILFEQLETIRKTVSIPLILMGYINPIYQYGFEAFCEKCNAIGIDGLIIPDLPVWEYTEHYKELFEKNNLHNIFLVSPQTSSSRIKEIDSISNGFIYIVSSAATTGKTSDISEEQISYFSSIQNMKLSTPQLIGFGISDNKSYTTACKYCHGVIIGSAFIKALQTSQTSIEKIIHTFIQGIREQKK